MKKGLLALMVVSGMTLMTACSGSSQTETTTPAQTAAKEETSQAEQASPKEAEESSAESAGGRFMVILRRGLTHGISAMWKDFRWERRRMATR